MSTTPCDLRPTLTVRELRANLAAVLARAEAGETVVITKRGRVVARVGPVEVGPVRAKRQRPEARRALVVRTVTDPEEYPVGEWYSRREGCASMYEFGYPEHMDHENGHAAEAVREGWSVYNSAGHTIASGSEGNLTANVIAADDAYRRAVGVDSLTVVVGPAALGEYDVIFEGRSS